ncbi:MAG: diguanylate cyclase [Deltaproteobacteria bacterium]|nr:diguanylate cyclase [Deltaproteobacteria bacterium]
MSVSFDVPSRDVKKPVVLIVDDDPVNIRVLAEVLASEVDIKIATDPLKALRIVAESPPPDLVLLDVMMPLMDGYEVCRKLKEGDDTRNLPVIFVTSLDAEDDEERGFRIGAVDYISKPFKPSLVRARVKTHLRLKRQADLLERLIAQDALTEIHNRRKFDQVLEAEWRRCARADEPISVVMLDVDHFKLFNDSLGHSAGDDCLRTIAQALNASPFRPGDCFARYGGEEFVAVLPSTDRRGAEKVGERFRKIVEDLSISHPGSLSGDVVTVSIGAATLFPGRVKLMPKELTHQADTALYQAKAAGRNRVCSALVLERLPFADEPNLSSQVANDDGEERVRWKR